MNDAGGGGAAPRGPGAGRGGCGATSGALAPWRAQHPLLSRRLQSPWVADRAAREAAGLAAVPLAGARPAGAAGRAGGRSDLAGVGGFGCEAGGAASGAAPSGLEQRPESREGQAGAGGGTNRR